MKISHSWLNNYLKLDLPIDEIADLLTDIGLEVEGIYEKENIKGGLKGVVIGEVLYKSKHPNADRLAITKVDIGDNEVLQIVCGAPNVDIGQKVPVATVGTTLFNADESFKIKKSKIRGEVSEGMICGADEIGLGEKTDGIMVLDSNIKSGTLASKYFELESDIIFDIGLTPNRSDAMGHIGVARDLMTAINYKKGNLQICKPSVEAFKVNNTSRTINVQVKEPQICPRYSGVSISNVKIADSPKWLQDKLKSIDLKPINNIVDITNFVLHETGQPLHAFDLDKITSKNIVVSYIKDKTEFISLDEVKREISSQDLMINNSNEPMCIAGVFGGNKHGVTNATNDIFLESAYFSPVSIRKTAKRHSLNTDASFRYERGCDPNITIYALKRASLLIKEICGGDIASEVIDIYPKKIKHFSVELFYKNMDSVIGEVIDRKVVQNILSDLEIIIESSNDLGLKLKVPPFKADVKREIDIIEEILRIYGYNNISIPSALNSTITYSNPIDTENIQNVISDLLTNSGFNEALNNSLIKSNFTDLITEFDMNHNINILNPLSQDLGVMRQSLLFNGLQNISYNLNRKNNDLKLYEFGSIYKKINKQYVENQHLQILACGRLHAENWNANNDKIDFFFIKEKVEKILITLGLAKVKSEKVKGHGFEESLIYRYKNKEIVRFGRVKNEVCKAFNININIYAADFNWDLIIEYLSKSSFKYNEISKFPEVRRDLSLLVKKSILFDDLHKITMKAEINILKSVNLFDVYEGEDLPDGMKSYALSFIFSDNTKTLTDQYIDGKMNKLISLFNKDADAEIR